MKIYLAGPITSAPRIRAYADSFRATGHEVVSTWHDVVHADTLDPSDIEERRRILMTNLRDLDSADVVFAYTCAGEPRTTFGEISWALCRGKRVLWSMPPGSGPQARFRNMFDAHALVTVCTSVEGVLPALEGMADGCR